MGEREEREGEEGMKGGGEGEGIEGRIIGMQKGRCGRGKLEGRERGNGVTEGKGRGNGGKGERE